MRLTTSPTLLLLLLGAASTLATGSGRNYHKPSELSEEEQWRRSIQEVYRRTYSNPRAREEYRRWHEDHKRRDDGIEIPPFTCDWDVAPGKAKADSVHELRPNDIGVVAALGDSVTAAFALGADIPATATQENRGESWDIGGNDDLNSVLTVPNIIRKFNPTVFGSSWSKPPVSCTAGLNCTQLNVAVSGATSRGIPGQMENMMEKMQDYHTEGRMDIDNDWKLVTILIGGNDLCRHCIDSEANSPETHVGNIRAAVDNLHSSVTRVLVQVVTMFDVSPIRNIEEDAEEYPDFCRNMHNVACSCALQEDSGLRDVQMAYWELLNEWINVEAPYDQENEFAVVLQTQLRDMLPVYTDGYFDLSFFGPDCFHPSRKGHQLFGLSLWNSMLTPVPEKTFNTSLDEIPDIKCPTEERPFIFTRRNSGVVKAEKMQIEEHDDVKEWEEKWANTWESVLKDDSMRDTYEQWREANSKDEEKRDLPTFDCDVSGIRKRQKAENVNELTPADIGVMAAFGDSISAGTGVDPDNAGNQHRGEVFSMGGNLNINEAVTLPNFIKEYNPSVFGWSWSKPPASCGPNLNCSQLNVAQNGATNRNFPGQADSLISRMEEYSAEGRMDYENDWKLVTMFIGGNDLCGVCRNDAYLPEPYVANIRDAVERLRAAVPRVLVQIVTMFDVTPIRNMTAYGNNTLYCRAIHLGVCSCAINDDDGSSRAIQMGYWRLLDEWINTNGTYDGIDDFTVVLQPYLRDMPAPYTDDGYFDMSYFSPDCFHPNRKMHRDVAYMLWEQMLTPVQDKAYVYPWRDIADVDYACPTEENPYIFTRGNSGLEKKAPKEPSIFDKEEASDSPASELVEYWEREQRATAKYHSFPQFMREHYEQIINKEEHLREDLEIPDWQCDPPIGSYDGAVEPSNVHELRPQDVNVVASFGDSITAGNGVGANTLPGVAIENRGEVWTVGGNGSIETHVTIPNILRQFNPSVHGWSWSRGSAVGDRNESHCAQGWNCAQLNVAEPGATCRNMLPQAEEMTTRMQNDENINFAEDWKLISLFIGGNDLCAVCRRWERYNPEQHVSDIKDALDYLYENVPRALVQVITMFDLSPIIEMKSGDPVRDVICNTMHNQFCDCAKNVTTNAQLRDIQMEYWERLVTLINEEGTYDQPGREDFSVVIQPYMRDMKPFVFEDGIWDMTYFSPDCFHPSKKMHFSMAYGLWNTMLTPVPEKVFDYPEEEELEFFCPSEERPYIFTNLNSEVKKDNADRPKTENVERPRPAAPALYEEHHKEHKAQHKQHIKAHTRTSHHHSDHSKKGNKSGVIMAGMLGCVFLATTILGVIAHQVKKRRTVTQATGDVTPKHFDNPAYEGI